VELGRGTAGNGTGLASQAGVSVFRMQEEDLLPRQQELADVQSCQHIAHVISLVRR